MPDPTVPSVLRTTRLMLRVSHISDFEDSAAMWGDPAVVRFIGGRPLSEEEVWSRLLRYAGLWSVLGFGYWTIRELATDRFVGEIGFANYRRDITPSLGDCPESGWVLVPWAQGRGYAREALEAALAWMDATIDAARTVCMIDPVNRPSIGLARRFGYAAFAPGLYRGSETMLFERPRPIRDPRSANEARDE